MIMLVVILFTMMCVVLLIFGSAGDVMVGGMSVGVDMCLSTFSGLALLSVLLCCSRCHDVGC